jgi:D-arabinose 1-dehydrogenase-like Zn-dependent alcohol dehydrogenase
VLGYAQGAFGEQVAAKHFSLLLIPSNITYAQAAGVYL